MSSSIRIALWISPILTLTLLGTAFVLSGGSAAPTASTALPLEWAGPAPTEPAVHGNLQLAQRQLP